MRRFTMPLLVLLASLGLHLPTATPAQAGVGYPFATSSPSSVDPWGYLKRQCVSFAAWRIAQRGHGSVIQGWGSAHLWNNRAHALGIPITSYPRGGAIAAWEPFETSYTYRGVELAPSGVMRAGSQGHVAVVIWHYRDGTALVEQYNADNRLGYSVQRVRAPRYLWVGL